MAYAQTVFNPNLQSYGYSDPNVGHVYGAYSNTQQTPAPTAPSAPSAPSPAPQPQQNNNGGGNPVPTIDPFLEEINRNFNERVGRLDSIGQSLKSQLPGAISDIEGQFGAQKGTLDAQKEQGTRQIGELETQAGERKEDVVTASRRLYNELNRGYQQRFGRASSAGRALGELAGVETQRSMADAQKNFEVTMRELSSQKQTLSERYDTVLLQLQASRDQAINQAKRELQNKLMEIERLKDEAGQAKADRRLAALQDYRNQVFQVNLQNDAYAKQIALQKNQDLASIDQYAQQLESSIGMGQSAYGNFENQTTVDPTSEYSNLLSVGGQVPQEYRGYRRPEDEGQAVGAINRRDDLRYGLA